MAAIDKHSTSSAQMTADYDQHADVLQCWSASRASPRAKISQVGLFVATA
jgi:hypothetical protein